MRLDRLDLNLIIALEAILRKRSVSDAAKELRLTQPALSRALGRLREHFEDPIVEQVGRKMIPTEFGLALYETSTHLLNATRHFGQMRPEFTPSTAQRNFKVMATDYVVRVLLAPALARLTKIAPDVSLTVLPVDVQASEEFQRGEVDFVIVPNRFLNDEHPHMALFTDEFVCVFCQNHPTIKGSLDRETFLSLRHAATAFGSNWQGSHFEQWISGQQISLKTTISLPSFTLLPECLPGTPLVATIHRSLWESLPENSGLRALPVPLPIPQITENLQWHRTRSNDLATCWMRDFLIEAAAKHCSDS
ncbi:MAG: hypothetical protein COB84_02485 [Rhodobacteraceae bacterium]|nr:MAG: hypothetical protein COB84_02485 [Paracoccaceae bacterium]